MKNMTAIKDMREETRVSFLTRMRTILSPLGQNFLDLFLPPLCLNCSQPIEGQAGLCASCRERIWFLRPPFCDLCGSPFPGQSRSGEICPDCRVRSGFLDRRRAVFSYDSASRGLILRLKYGDHLHAVPVYGGWMLDYGGLLLSEADILIPVPLHWMRLWKRRYNQAAVLARDIARQSGKPVCCDALIRTRPTKPQISMNSRQRRLNIAGAFDLRSGRAGLIDGRRILLIDDVFTSGATAEACADILKQAGASTVDLLTLAVAYSPKRAHHEKARST